MHAIRNGSPRSRLGKRPARASGYRCLACRSHAGPDPTCKLPSQASSQKRSISETRPAGALVTDPRETLSHTCHSEYSSSGRRNIISGEETARGRRGCGRVRKAGELSRQVDRVGCSAQVTGRAAVHSHHEISRSGRVNFAASRVAAAFVARSGRSTSQRAASQQRSSHVGPAEGNRLDLPSRIPLENHRDLRRLSAPGLVHIGRSRALPGSPGACAAMCSRTRRVVATELPSSRASARSNRA